MGVEHLDQVFLGDRRILSEVRPGPLEDPLIGEIAAADQYEQRGQDCADQQKMQRTDGVIFRPTQRKPATPRR